MKKFLFVCSVIAILSGSYTVSYSAEKKSIIETKEDKFTDSTVSESKAETIFYTESGALSTYVKTDVQMSLGKIKQKKETLYYLRVVLIREGKNLNWFEFSDDLFLLIDNQKYNLKLLKNFDGKSGVTPFTKKDILGEEAVYSCPVKFIKSLSEMKESFEVKLVGKDNQINFVKEKNPISKETKEYFNKSADTLIKN